MLKTVLPLLSVAGGARPLGMKARDLHRKLGQNDVGRYRINYDIFSHEEKQNLMHADTQAALRTDPVNVHISYLLQQSNAHTLAEKFAVSDLALWVREHFNQRVDRMTMMHSIEGRVPFQDMEVVELALRVPMPVKMRGGRGKYLLRTAFSDLLPESVLKRPKRPFSTPTQTWLRDPLRPFVENLLSEKAIGAGGLLNGKAVQQVLQRFMAGEDTAAFKVWALLNLQAWQQVALQ
jgi:asparagine synthase (glutamine-hydrolysing)